MKSKFRSIALAAIFALLPHSSQAETVLTGVEIRDMESCMTVLAEFNWVCQEFDHDGWVSIYGRSFWQRGHVLFYRHDIDGDGTEDGIVKIEHVGTCSRGGPDCGHMFLFGDQPVAEHPHAFGIMGLGAPVLTGRNGIEGMYFSISSREIFRPIDELRRDTLQSPQWAIE